MKCQRCGAENEQGNTFCFNCGNRLHQDLVKFCPKCGGINSPDASFCRSCGEEFASTEPKTVDTIWDTSKAEAEEKQAEQVYKAPVDPYEDDDWDDDYEEPKRQKKEKNKQKRSKMPILWVLEIIACVVLTVFAVNQGNETYSAQRQAEAYFANVASGRYDTAFDQTNLETSDFVDADAFANYWSQVDFTNADNYSAQVSEETASAATVQISYGSDQNLSIAMTADGKKLVLFDNWVVDASLITMSNVTIQVPVGATVSLDGEEVSTSYITESDVEIAGNQADIYVIPAMMAGRHTIAVNAGSDGVTEYVVEPEAEGTLTLIGQAEAVQMDVTALQETAVNNVKAVLTAASTDAEFDTISSLFMNDDEIRSQISSEYASLRAYFGQSDAPAQVRISGVTTSANPEEKSVTVNLNYEYDYYTSDSTTARTKGGTTSYTITFEESDGVWYQTNLGVTSFQ